MTPSLTLIILNYNAQQWLHQTLTTLKFHYLDHSNYQVQTIVVDSASSDDSVSMVRDAFPWVKQINLKTNNGFAAGNNVALQQVQTEYVMLLNSDLEFTDQSNLDLLLQYMEQHHQVGMITPKLYLDDHSLDMAAHRGEPTPWASFTYFTKLERLFPKWKLFAQYHQTYKDLNSIHEIDACSGAAMLIRTSALKKVGLLDERFFMYAEDLDWCHRFRDQGFKIVFYPKVVIIHHKNKSGRQSNQKLVATKTNEYFYDTMMQYYDKYYTHRYPWVYKKVLQKIINKKKES